MKNTCQEIVTPTIDEIFPYTVCINLDRRAERWQQMRREFARHGLHSVRRFPAIDGEAIELPEDWVHTPGAYGCLRSHIEVVREARAQGVERVLILEDDVAFDDDLARKFAAGIADLPHDWDMLFFGALHKEEPIPITENLVRITRANSTFACALRDTVFDAFIELNSNTREVLDHNSFVLQQQFNCYCFMPHLAWVDVNVSDAQQRLMDHWYLRESVVVFGAEVDRLLNETTIIFAHRTADHYDHATENLMYLVSYYHHYFSANLEMIVVDQGRQPAIDAARLPAGCKYVFHRADGPADSATCFAAGMQRAEPARRRFIFIDSDIYLETLHLRASLRMCERYDYVAGFDKIIDLNQADSVRLRAARTPHGIDLTRTSPDHNGRESVCLFVNRAAIQPLVEGDANSQILSRLISLPANSARTFQSPNHALRLH
ncbi:MAG TPA: glycosyltransferase family 25 protein [Pyrinomonadaceae bacterium]|nr:glycosyltransferase family 25 protein [Pyrinomonadaceae bacterium]